MKKTFQRTLLAWFKNNKRNLPWRNQNEWYKTFLSEILLQQTQVDQAIPYYTKFISKYPDINALAWANEDTILTLWAGLGYYARARNLLKSAKIISDKFNGDFPTDWKLAISLPGIGPYSAAAILSIAFNKPYAVLDGNVFRVLSRLHLLSDDIRLPITHKKFQKIADDLLDINEPGNFNEAMMELGAVVCLPVNPDCANCPLQTYCLAYKEQKQAELPFKSPPAPKRNIKHFVLLIQSNKQLLIRQRPSKGLLARMWEFPFIETHKLSLPKKEIAKLVIKETGINPGNLLIKKKMTHIYSHIKLDYVPVFISVPNKEVKMLGDATTKWMHLQDLKESALHGAHQKILLLPTIMDLINN